MVEKHNSLITINYRWTFAPRPGDMGGGERLQREREAVSTGERWRVIRDRSAGRDKYNERSQKKVK